MNATETTTTASEPAAPAEAPKVGGLVYVLHFTQPYKHAEWP